MMLGFVPGMPTFIFFALGAGGLGLAYVTSKPIPHGEEDDSDPTAGDATNPPEQRQEAKVAMAQRASLDDMLPMVTPIMLELAPALAAELNDPRSRFVSELLPDVRNALFFELGIRCTTVRMRPNPYLGENTYAIYVNEVPERVDTARPGMMLVSETAERLQSIGVNGESAHHPLSGAPATWVPEVIGMKFREAGIEAWSYEQYIAFDIQAALHRSASDLLGMHDVQEMLEQLEQAFPAMVREVVPKLMTLSRLTDVLKRLIDEGVSVRNLKAILESIARWGTFLDDNAELVERIRADLRDAISFKHGGVSKSISAYLFSSTIEDAVVSAIQTIDGTEQLALAPEIAHAIVEATKATTQGSNAGITGPLFLTRPDIRRHVREILRTELAGAVVLSYRDLRPELVVEPIARIEVD
jgi:type III secretion protein V